MINNYREVYMPEHPKARRNGCVYEHILVAEKKLGRYLKDKEVVHHIDENRGNNSEDNLIIFDSVSSHTRYHHSGILIGTEDPGVFTSGSRKFIKRCSTCGNPIDRQADLCEPCYRLTTRKVERPSADELKNLLSNNSWKSTGRMFGVSDNSVRKWAKRYSLL